MFDLTSMHYASENCQYSELVGEPLRPELNINFFLEHIIDFMVLGKQISLVKVGKFRLIGMNI